MDKDWATDFLLKLNACHAEFGALFSQPVYESFFEFRKALITVERKLRLGKDEDVGGWQVLQHPTSKTPCI